MQEIEKKTVQYILHKNPELASRNDIVLWHDLINNSTSKQIDNNFQCLSAFQLNRLLNNYRKRITATVYCHREGTDNILPVLQESAPLTTSILNHTVSRKNAKNKTIQKQYKILQQVSCLELKTLTIIVRHSKNLKTIVEKIKQKKKYG